MIELRQQRIDVAEAQHAAVERYVSHLRRAIEQMPVYGRDDRRFRERVLSIIGPVTTDLRGAAADASRKPAAAVGVDGTGVRSG